MTIADTARSPGRSSGGKLRALAITTDKRDAAFPDVPTLAEAGVPDMAISLWTGLVAPAGTPAEIVAAQQGHRRDPGCPTCAPRWRRSPSRRAAPRPSSIAT